MSISEDIKALEEALARKPDAQPIYMHWRDSNNWKANEAFVIACSPDRIRRLLDALKNSDAVQTWQERKANLDAADDGHGPDTRFQKKTYWAEFKRWAWRNLGQGCSLACNDGDILDAETFYAYRGFAYSLGRAEDAEARLSKAIDLLKRAAGEATNATAKECDAFLKEVSE